MAPRWLIATVNSINVAIYTDNRGLTDRLIEVVILVYKKSVDKLIRKYIMPVTMDDFVIIRMYLIIDLFFVSSQSIQLEPS